MCQYLRRRKTHCGSVAEVKWCTELQDWGGEVQSRDDTDDSIREKTNSLDGEIKQGIMKVYSAGSFRRGIRLLLWIINNISFECMLWNYWWLVITTHEEKSVWRKWYVKRKVSAVGALVKSAADSDSASDLLRHVRWQMCLSTGIRHACTCVERHFLRFTAHQWWALRFSKIFCCLNIKIRSTDLHLHLNSYNYSRKLYYFISKSQFSSFWSVSLTALLSASHLLSVQPRACEQSCWFTASEPRCRSHCCE